MLLLHFYYAKRTYPKLTTLRCFLYVRINTYAKHASYSTSIVPGGLITAIQPPGCRHGKRVRKGPTRAPQATA